LEKRAIGYLARIGAGKHNSHVTEPQTSLG
jgi:hypothetical protein